MTNFTFLPAAVPDQGSFRPPPKLGLFFAAAVAQVLFLAAAEGVGRAANAAQAAAEGL